MKTIGIDIDGVIANFVPTFITVVEKRYGITIKESDIATHDLYQVLGISPNIALDLINETLQMDLDVMSGAVEYLKLLKDKNKIILITARKIDENITKEWLRKHSIPYDKIMFLEEGNKFNCDIELDVMVDDNLKEIINCQSIAKKLIIYDHPWNQTYDVEKKFYRVKNWKEIYDLINKI